jgi:hypothetical protein
MDPYLGLKDPDADPEGPKTYETHGSGSATLVPGNIFSQN